MKNGPDEKPKSSNLPEFNMIWYEQKGTERIRHRIGFWKNKKGWLLGVNDTIIPLNTFLNLFKVENKGKEPGRT